MNLECLEASGITKKPKGVAPLFLQRTLKSEKLLNPRNGCSQRDLTAGTRRRVDNFRWGSF